MDSACAINGGINPSARCQYCGTSNAGTPPAQKGLSNITAGQSTKYAISSKDLAKAPSDPSKRYNWAANECVKKLPDCTTDDVADAYDKLIEQSCKAAGVTMQIAKLSTDVNKKQTKSKCEPIFTTCMNKKCGTTFDSCANDADLDRSIAECAADANGCDDYISDFRKTFSDARDRAIGNRENVLNAIAEKYQSARKAKTDGTLEKCRKGTASETCIKTVCANNMRGKCDGADAADERSMATQLCKFYDTACTVLK